MVVAGSLGISLGWAREEPAEPVTEITGHYETGLNASDAASAGAVTRRRIESRPLSRPGEVIELVPGMIVTQHSGDGKANQYFLRGYNLDHGTDFAISVDGMPVNMPTHAHGQGYADINFRSDSQSAELAGTVVSGAGFRGALRGRCGHHGTEPT
jgi:hypothetical protein